MSMDVYGQYLCLGCGQVDAIAIFNLETLPLTDQIRQVLGDTIASKKGVQREAVLDLLDVQLINVNYCHLYLSYCII